MQHRTRTGRGAQLLTHSGNVDAQGIACNMARPGDVAALANFARDKLGTVDLWCAVAPSHVAGS